MIPFFVVDRPVSLEMLKGFFLRIPKKCFGILTYAFVLDNFGENFGSLPKMHHLTKVLHYLTR